MSKSIKILLIIVFGIVLSGCQQDSAPTKPTTDKGLINNPPVPKSQHVTLDEDTPAKITLEASDLDDDNITFVITLQPAHGKLSGEPPHIVYHPDLNYNGTDFFSFSVNDGQTDALGDANVTLVINPVNDQPVAKDHNLTTLEDTNITIELNATDVDGDKLLYSIKVPPKHGKVNNIEQGNPTYIPDPNYYGSDSFIYTVSDGQLHDDANVSITIISVNDAPVAHDDNVSTDQNVSILIDALSNDTDVENDPLTIVEANSTEHAIVTIKDNKILYQPDLMFFGSDTVHYTIEDIHGDRGSADIHITVKERPYITAIKLILPKSSINRGTTITAKVEATYSNGTHREIADAKLQASPQEIVSISGYDIEAKKDQDASITAKATNWLGEKITSPSVSLSIYWEVDGQRLPPAPDPAANNATLHGIDANGDGIRDDVERYIYEVESTHPRYPKTIRALSLQFAKAFLDIIDDPSFERYKGVDKAISCQRYFDRIHTDTMSYQEALSWYKDNLRVNMINLQDQVFNTRERILRRIDYLVELHGHTFRYTMPDKQKCNFDIDNLGE